MRCPVDGETLLMTAREGIEIDYCPRCRGVWLDRGELDKLVEREGARDASVAGSDDPRDDRQGRETYRQKPKRKRFIEELFDFG